MYKIIDESHIRNFLWIRFIINTQLKSKITTDKEVPLVCKQSFSNIREVDQWRPWVFRPMASGDLGGTRKRMCLLNPVVESMDGGIGRRN